MDKKLVTKSYPQSGGQWLNVQMEISDEGSLLGLIPFNIFNDIDSGIKCLLQLIRPRDEMPSRETYTGLSSGPG